uniref:Uncharacterized protein MANES_09G123600 n=1 Tax=Rhizophora mucronata TaxID=61149 RepID=A0A2P2JRY8_RHIMU
MCGTVSKEVFYPQSFFFSFVFLGIYYALLFRQHQH